MAKYNIIARCKEGAEYIMTELIATSASKKDFEAIKDKSKYFNNCCFIAYNDTDFCWWDRITKLLTINKSRISKNIYNFRVTSGWRFDCDFFGNITKY